MSRLLAANRDGATKSVEASRLCLADASGGCYRDLHACAFGLGRGCGREDLSVMVRGL